MSRFPCPYLKSEVELTEERERHIAERHPDAGAPGAGGGNPGRPGPSPEERSVRKRQVVLAMVTDLQRGKHVMVVVVSELDPTERHWIITAYITRRLAEGEVEWRRN